MDTPTSTSLERLRRRLKLSQESFAERLGVSRTLVCGIEAGRVKLTAERALRCADLWPAEVKAEGGVEVLLRGSR